MRTFSALARLRFGLPLDHFLPLLCNGNPTRERGFFQHRLAYASGSLLATSSPCCTTVTRRVSEDSFNTGSLTLRLPLGHFLTLLCNGNPTRERGFFQHRLEYGSGILTSASGLASLLFAFYHIRLGDQILQQFLIFVARVHINPHNQLEPRQACIGDVATNKRVVPPQP